MIDAARLGGFFTAHAVWSVCDGDTLIPLFGHEDEGGERQLERLAIAPFEAGIAEGKSRLADNRRGAARAVFIFDGYVTLDEWRTDALLVEVRCYSSGGSLALAIPYRHAEDTNGFAIFRPRILAAEPEDQLDPIMEAFWQGVDSHEGGAKVWDEHVDQSR